jgi:hypothetical protein
MSRIERCNRTLKEIPGMPTGTHQRNIRPMLTSPRCRAHTRSGTPCRSPAVAGKKRCRMHGGAAGSGAPKGNRNAFKHGLHAKAAVAERNQARALMRQAHKLLQGIESSYRGRQGMYFAWGRFGFFLPPPGRAIDQAGLNLSACKPSPSQD